MIMPACTSKFHAKFARESAMLKLPEERRRWGESKGAGRGWEREEKTPVRKHCENEKHPLARDRSSGNE